jgi:hypothetical protein
MYHGVALSLRCADVHPFAGAVVEIVRLEVMYVGPVIVNVSPELKVALGGLDEFAGLEVNAAVRLTFPTNPPLGATVTLESLLATAPGARLTGVP